MRDLYIGIDVGTGSARAGVFDQQGMMLGSASREIQLFHPQLDYVEQSSSDIWRAVCASVKTAIEESQADVSEIKGIGFDATCSLVALDGDDNPVTISPTGQDEQNVIVWMDHRAVDQAERINKAGHSVLQYVGHVISPEMQTPKLLWLKEHLPRSWNRTRRFFDLPDFLTYKATGNDTRSLCSTVCKWTYLGHEKGEGESVGRWDDSYFEQIGLGDLAADRFVKIGVRIRPMGESIGGGLAAKPAAELGLNEGTAIAVSIIDAHAGGIGMIGAGLDGSNPAADDLETRLALIGGTSSCHMAVSREPKFIKGIWGPYYSAMIPGMWLTEGGQSATGSLIDFVICNHGASLTLRDRARSEKKTVYEILNERLTRLSREQPYPAALTRELHVCPYFHGNRSPRANPNLRVMISGLRMSATLDDLAILYLAVIQAIAHGAKHIIDEMNRHGYRIKTIFACGGGTKNPVFLKEHADITECAIVLNREPESMLLGSAMLGAVASGRYKNLRQVMPAMSGAGDIIHPGGGEIAAYHQKKHEVFLKLHEDQLAYRCIMNGDHCSDH
ncbi:MAG: FGGY-family carbohydrate kinase [Candidatus Eisenbacteria bacterium]|nr:FGGY-family carbohydrate kinase [Candidatus Eisenbacteria bacterium]